MKFQTTLQQLFLALIHLQVLSRLVRLINLYPYNYPSPHKYPKPLRLNCSNHESFPIFNVCTPIHIQIIPLKY